MKTIDITHEVRCILTTVHALEGKFGAGYVNRLLRADDKFPVREKHLSMETYGALESMTRDRLRSLINWLILNRYLGVSAGDYPVISVTAKGMELGKTNPHLEIPYRDLNAANSDITLLENLRNMRRSIANERNIAPYHIFTDMVMDEIVRQKPETPDALAAIPGMTPVKVETYGEAILAAVSQEIAARKASLKEQLEQRASSAKGQQIKGLHDTGLSVDEIAEQMQVKRGIVEYYLEALHLTGQINLVNWVATNLNEQPALNMGVAYFRKWRDARLTEAQQALGLDFYTLRLCRWYALAA